MTIRNLEHLFRPKSIAVIGASNTPQSVGQTVMRNLLTGGFDGPILPVNPKWDTVASVLAYPDVGHLPLVPDLFYASVHQAPLYPGTGAARERGCCNNIINVPLAPMAGSLEFRRQIGERILPSLAKFEPHFILISAGFDGHESEPPQGAGEFETGVQHMKSYPIDRIPDDLEPWPFVGETSNYKIVRGNPQASGRQDLGGTDSKHRLGIWRCTAGAFECTERGDELQTIMTGRLRIVQADGSVQVFGPGDSFFTRKGERIVWDIIEDVTKVFFTYDRDGEANEHMGA